MAQKKPSSVQDGAGESHVQSGQKHPGGRPTDYDPELCEQVIELGREGKSLTQISAAIDIARSTLYEWRNTHPEFSDAITRAQELSQAWWEDQGQIGLTAPCFNSSLWAKQVSCRFSDDYRETTRQEVTGKNGGPVETKSTLDASKLTIEQIRAIASIKIHGE